MSVSGVSHDNGGGGGRGADPVDQIRNAKGVFLFDQRAYARVRACLKTPGVFFIGETGHPIISGFESVRGHALYFYISMMYK